MFRRFPAPRRHLKRILLFTTLFVTVIFLILHLLPPADQHLASRQIPHHQDPQEGTRSDMDLHKTSCYILVMILSTPGNRENRDILRRNSYLAYPWQYNNALVEFRHIFILGKTGDAGVNLNVSREAEQFRDMAIGNFADSYGTLSIKVTWGFQYVLKNFNFKFCMKVDEDSFVNLSYLSGYLSQVKQEDYQDLYAGKPRQGDLAVPKTGRFYAETTGGIEKYVQYNLGGGYILSAPAMRRILTVHNSHLIQIIAWEDVYIGTLANMAGLIPTRIYHYYVSRFFPFCTDETSILLHHTPPILQAKMLSHYHLTGVYCPKDMEELNVRTLLNSYSIINWNED